MKKKLIIILSIIVCSTSLLSSCSLIAEKNEDSPPATNQTDTATDSTEKIKELEAKIISILQSQQLSETERKQEISSLKAEIEKLKNEALEKESGSSSSEDSSDSASEQPADSAFSYTLNGYSATITSINTNEDTVIIPSVIDGYAVIGIGQEVLKKDCTIKRIIISSGISTIDWFAFKGASSLLSITIPSSVTSIGYGVFDGAPKSFTIECAKDSFAMKYAQSYGIKYNTN